MESSECRLGLGVEYPDAWPWLWLFLKKESDEVEEEVGVESLSLLWPECGMYM